MNKKLIVDFIEENKTILDLIIRFLNQDIEELEPNFLKDNINYFKFTKDEVLESISDDIDNVIDYLEGVLENKILDK